MNEQIKRIIDPLQNFWGKLTKKTKIVFFVCLGVAVVLAVVASVVMNRTQYTVLYSGVSSDEGKQITSELSAMNASYKYSGNTIYIDKAKEDTARMQLANEGYPKSTPNYDFFTGNVGIMTTDEERKIIEQYQLEERLGAVIKTLDSVDTAYVTISLPENTSYAWEDNQSEASASVAIGLVDGKSLDAKQVNGIKQLISKSVPNLKTDNITVMDTSTGEELTASSSEPEGSTQITLTEFKLKIEKQYEDNLQKKILNLLAQAYGRKNLSVSVTSKMDLDKKIQDIVTYTPSASGGKGVVSRSEETYETQVNSSASGGVAGTQSNSDTTTTTYPGVTVNGNIITTKDSKTYEYLVSKVEEQIQSDAAALDDLTVAVVINTDSMTDEKKQEVTSLVANAAAVDVSKVAVMAAMPESSAVESQQAQTTFGDIAGVLAGNQVMLIAAGTLLLLILLLIVLLSAKRRNARREQLLANLQQTVPPEPEILEEEPFEEEADDMMPSEENEEIEETAETVEAEKPEVAAAPEEPEEEPPIESIEEIRNASGGAEKRVRTELQDFSNRNPEIAAQLIRSWLKGDDGRRG
jgi:flagellar M-ring protein FliF